MTNLRRKMLEELPAQLFTPHAACLHPLGG